jgi:6-pyruvoyltetrahydropterin/6-carboxytetrahydropterin synthase
MYKISKQFAFSASHILNMPDRDHPCARLHGHNYIVTIHLKSKLLDRLGFVKDYNELESVNRFIKETFDHRHLNDVISVNPTSENIARIIYERFKPEISELYAVEVSETPKTSCIYEPQD